MKSVIYLSVGLLAGVMAQDSLAGCGALASDLGCTAGDTACLCRNVNFTYGIRDCSLESCQQASDAQQAVAAGVDLCRQAGVAVQVSPVVTVVQPTGTATATASVSGGSSVATPSAVTTSTFSTVITSGGSTITSVGETTIFGVGGVPGASSAPASAITTAPIVSTITSDGTVITSTIGSTTILSSLTGSDASSALSSQASDASEASTATATDSATATVTETQSETGTQTQTGAATSASESGNAAKQTAVPIAGFLAAAGLAAMLI
ncbi:GPI-anchored CFEM domain protein ARB_01545 [Colletotrichum spaethianum]|uniref:GPI-anchored CFEM domain protein ARB_01545 n=1 Tax=Colletotrichum spaethianum TaxID=700344 RepID=A0AA37PCY0_9PEZI|nr:GPI-anchored CFEM domain protein ARB_01545 [Colletotrichum spaethianum]GKT49899.1 GPI-anchored CFEM domain protein ARB_01545 [Colletotrichum spaethianum]